MQLTRKIFTPCYYYYYLNKSKTGLCGVRVSFCVRSSICFFYRTQVYAFHLVRFWFLWATSVGSCYNEYFTWYLLCSIKWQLLIPACCAPCCAEYSYIRRASMASPLLRHICRRCKVHSRQEYVQLKMPNSNWAPNGSKTLQIIDVSAVVPYVHRYIDIERMMSIAQIHIVVNDKHINDEHTPIHYGHKYMRAHRLLWMWLIGESETSNVHSHFHCRWRGSCSFTACHRTNTATNRMPITPPKWMWWIFRAQGKARHGNARQSKTQSSKWEETEAYQRANRRTKNHTHPFGSILKSSIA